MGAARDLKMNTQSLLRARMASQTIARRGFSTTRPRFDSPFHYPEGPRSGLPFNPKTRFFWLRYWTFMGVGFSIPFGMAVWHTYKKKRSVADCIGGLHLE